MWGSEDQYLIWKASRWQPFQGKQHETGREAVQGHGNREGERKVEVRDDPTEESTREHFFYWLKICKCLKGEEKGAILLWHRVDYVRKNQVWGSRKNRVSGGQHPDLTISETRQQNFLNLNHLPGSQDSGNIQHCHNNKNVSPL